MYPVLFHRLFSTLGHEVSTDQAVEINQDHNIHHYHGEEEELPAVQLVVVGDDVPGEVGLGAQTKQGVGEDVEMFVDVEHARGVSVCQLQQQPQVEGDAVDLHEESD